MFSRWCIMRSGFRQETGSWLNGCVDIYGIMSRQYAGNGNQVILENWDASPEHTADFIARLGPDDEKPTVGIFGYSWGCGYGAMKLARNLRQRGIAVRYMVLCDPVYYSWAKWRALIPIGIFGRLKIKVPSNVQEVWWLRQHVSRPAGHDLVAEGPYTEIHTPVVLEVPHVDMDNTMEFRTMCMRVAERIFQ